MAANMNFQNGGRRHLGLFESKILRQRKLRPSRMYLERRPSYGCLCVFKIAAVEFISGVDFLSYRRFLDGGSLCSCKIS